MFLLRAPSEAQIRRYRDREAARPFSYRAVGATAATPPRGWTVDHNRVRLGEGPEVWARAVAAAAPLGDVPSRLGAPLAGPTRRSPPASTVVVVSRQAGLWALNASRIVYAIDTPGPTRRCGFAYGTLPGHAERGEERFLVEWQTADDAVWYDILAFSRPRHPLAILGLPITRRVAAPLRPRFAGRHAPRRSGLTPVAGRRAFV